MSAQKARSPDSWDVRRLWSLLDMLKQYAAFTARFVWGLGDYERDLTWRNLLARSSLMDKDQILGEKDAEFIESYLQDAKLSAERLGLDAVTPQAERMLNALKEGNYRIDTVARDLQDMRLRILDQLDSRLFYFVAPALSRYYTEPCQFGPEVDAAFPSASPEISEAGKCFALGRYSASVFHLMRCLEVGIQCMAAPFSVDASNKNWQNVLDEIAKAVRAMNYASHGPNWKLDEQFYSEAIAHFLILKNAWRNYAMHLHERYDEERALMIFDNVRTFMRQLAKRLKE